MIISKINHCVKSVRVRSYSGPLFSRIFPHSDWIRRDSSYLFVFSPNVGKRGKNADQNNSEYGHFLPSEYGNKSRLLFTDTDSLLYKVETENVYDEFSKNKEMFDFSNYSAKSKSNALVVDKIKDEM